MKSVSTLNLNLLPPPTDLQRFCKSLAALEAILCPEWHYRYYTYNRYYSNTEEFCEMHDGQGNYMHILFCKHGTVINGFALDSVMNGWNKVQRQKKHNFIEKLLGPCPTNAKPIQRIWDGVTKGLPATFHEFILGEPVSSTGTTFCVWQLSTDEQWQTGKIKFPEDEYKDGSEDLMMLLDGNPYTYTEWATEYYELDTLDSTIINQIYNHAPITTEMVKILNPELANVTTLKADLTHIGYKHWL